MTYDMHVDLHFPYDPNRSHLPTHLRDDEYHLHSDDFEDYMSQKLCELRANIAADIDPMDKLCGWRIWRDEMVIAQWGKVS